MAYGSESQEDLSQLSGGALREKLEEALKQNRQLAEKLTTHQARDVLAEKGFDLVKPEDLKGVDPEKIEARAQEIQAEREAISQELLRKALEKKGFTGEELDEMVQSAVEKRDASSPQADAMSRVRSLGTGGERVPEVNPEKLHGYDAIRAALEQPKRKAS